MTGSEEEEEEEEEEALIIFACARAKLERSWEQAPSASSRESPGRRQRQARAVSIIACRKGSHGV